MPQNFQKIKNFPTTILGFEAHVQSDRKKSSGRFLAHLDVLY